ncbi:MAG: hypothetical protein V8Q23_04260, partial [Eubacteriales bacterium]
CPNEIELRIMGTEGCLEWRQTRPDEVVYIKKGEAPARSPVPAMVLMYPQVNWLVCRLVTRRAIYRNRQYLPQRNQHYS